MWITLSQIEVPPLASLLHCALLIAGGQLHAVHVSRKVIAAVLGREGAPKKQRASTGEFKIETSGAIVEDRRIVRGDKAQHVPTGIRSQLSRATDRCGLAPRGVRQAFRRHVVHGIVCGAVRRVNQNIGLRNRVEDDLRRRGIHAGAILLRQEWENVSLNRWDRERFIVGSAGPRRPLIRICEIART